MKLMLKEDVVRIAEGLAKEELQKRVRTHPRLVAALQRVGCQDAGSCSADADDGLCFVCAVLAEAA